MNEHTDNTRRQLGELGAMASQNDAMERQILERAQSMLAEIDGRLDKARAEAMAGDDGARLIYTDMVAERGRLQQVIAHARQVLRTGDDRPSVRSITELG